ncbi:MAG: hypothetical protein ACKPFA_17250, partial [Dolichospermum sp.]
SDLLTLLEKRGLLLEDKEANKLYIKSIDKFGDPAKAEFKDVLPKMLKQNLPILLFLEMEREQMPHPVVALHLKTVHTILAA